MVNCVQSHPFDSVVATSGIDSTIKVSVLKETSLTQLFVQFFILFYFIYNEEMVMHLIDSLC